MRGLSRVGGYHSLHSHVQVDELAHPLRVRRRAHHACLADLVPALNAPASQTEKIFNGPLHTCPQTQTI